MYWNTNCMHQCKTVQYKKLIIMHGPVLDTLEFNPWVLYAICVAAISLASLKL